MPKMIVLSEREKILRDIAEINSWTELLEVAPVNLSRVQKYAANFEAHIGSPILITTLEFNKSALLNARNDLDLMITTLLQVLYSDDILTTPVDRVLFAWLKDDLGRFLQGLDEAENQNIIVFDNPNADQSRVGVSRLSSYSKTMNNAYRAFFEALLKSTKEYYSFVEDSEKSREPRTFLYILFQVFRLTMSVLGSVTRNPSGSKKGTVNSMPSTWQGLISTEGQSEMRKDFEKETGEKLQTIPDVPVDFLETGEDVNGQPF